MKTILFILGTRPEAIKLAPLILEFKKYPNIYNVIICNTEQQKELSNQALEFFNIKADILLDVMTENQNLNMLQVRILEKLQILFMKNSIDITIVQGDTMSAFAGALASYFNKIPIFHIETGLRSYNLDEPFPEEAIRQMVSRISTFHFAPTQEDFLALQKENLSTKNIYLTGNTAIDALELIDTNVIKKAKKFWLNFGINIENDNLVLITVHRRENHGFRLDSILKAIKSLSNDFPDHKFIIPVHPNPNVKNNVYTYLREQANILLIEPLEYPNLICAIKHAKLILTDSGGIQEEAPTFGCPILVLRYETERKEGVKAGFSKLVGADFKNIYNESFKILSHDKINTRINKTNPYGDGFTSRKIEKIARGFLYE